MLRLSPTTGRRAIAAAAAVAALFPAAATAAKPGGSERYVGKTADELRVELRVSRDGRSIARFAIRYRVSCSNGAEGPVSTEVFDVPIRRDGTFSYRGSYRKRVDRSRNNVKLSGRVSRRVASGKFSLNAVGRPEGSEERVTCNSGTVRWRAPRDT